MKQFIFEIQSINKLIFAIGTDNIIHFIINNGKTNTGKFLEFIKEMKNKFTIDKATK